MNPGGHGVRVEVAGARDDRGNARADVVPLDARGVADANVLNVGDGIQRTRAERADREPDVAGPGSLVVTRHGQRTCE